MVYAMITSIKAALPGGARGGEEEGGGISRDALLIAQACVTPRLINDFTIYGYTCYN